MAGLRPPPHPLQSQSCPYRFLGFSRTDCSAQPFTVFDGIPAAPTFIFTIVSPTAPAVLVGRGAVQQVLGLSTMLLCFVPTFIFTIVSPTAPAVVGRVGSGGWFAAAALGLKCF